MVYRQEKIHRGFVLREKNGVQLMEIPSFLEHGFTKHAFTTRNGGVSRGEFASLNLSRTRENSPENKKENYRRAAAAVGVTYESLTLVRYAHGDGIVTAKRTDAGKGIARATDFDLCDAMIVCEPGVTAVTLHADCMPVFAADTEKRTVCVAHAGWKGVFLELPGKIIAKMKTDFKSRPQDIIVGIGPHIMRCCFEVGEEVALPFAEKFGEGAVARKNGKWFVDLQWAVLEQLLGQGISEEHITCADCCTYCREDLFYSHRRDRGKTGAMGSFIAL